MQLTTLIARVRAGDPSAFTTLVQRYQELALGYAFAILRDFPLAQDAAQQAFIEVHGSLAGLEDPEKFPGWLRGIVRHQCARLVRRRRVLTVALDAAAGVAAATPGPERRAEDREALDLVLQAVATLPPLEREVVVLYYIREYSQREVAAFLGLPVTTVNNRLHAARRHLRAAFLPLSAVSRALERHRLPAGFASEVGRIVRVRGPLVDIRCADGAVPAIFDALTVAGSAPDSGPLQVAQHPGGGIARCIAGPTASAPAGPDRPVTRADDPGGRALGHETVRLVVELLGRHPTPGPTALLETGIKAIDLFCPFPEGGRIGVFSDIGVGKMVLLQELVRRIPGARPRLTVFAFVRAADEIPFLRRLADREADVFPSSAAVQVVYLPVDDPRALAADPAATGFDATVYLTRRLALAGVFPAIDPLVSSSRLLRADTVGEEHHATVRAARRLVRQDRQRRAGDGPASPPDDERTPTPRIGRVEQFLAQPLFVAAPWTGRPGQFVPRDAAVRGVRAVVADAGQSASAGDRNTAVDHPRSRARAATPAARG